MEDEKKKREEEEKKKREKEESDATWDAIQTSINISTLTTFD